MFAFLCEVYKVTIIICHRYLLIEVTIRLTHQDVSSFLLFSTLHVNSGHWKALLVLVVLHTIIRIHFLLNATRMNSIQPQNKLC
jgi:hypothetical protein